jgi:putative pyruvate formate lyase activating enzyme
MKEELGRKYSKVKNYPSIATTAIKEMFRQVGNLKVDEKGVAYKGILVRHLVLPNNIMNSFQVIDFLAELHKGLAVNIMDQYFPYYKAFEYPELSRLVDSWEMEKVKIYAYEKGLWLVD